LFMPWQLLGDICNEESFKYSLEACLLLANDSMHLTVGNVTFIT
jgi:hypothetical protein